MRKLLASKLDKIFLFGVFAFAIAAGIYVHSISTAFESELSAHSEIQAHDIARIITAVESIEDDIRDLQFGNKQQHFELVMSSLNKLRILTRAVSEAHNYEQGLAKTKALQLIVPVVNDVSIWYTEGIGDEPANSPTVHRLVSQHLHLTRVTLDEIHDTASNQTVDLLTDQSTQLKSFGRTVIFLLVGLAGLLTVAGLLYARNRQAQENLWHQRKLVTDSINNINEGFILTAPNGQAQVVNNALANMCAPLADSLLAGVPYINALEQTLISSDMIRMDTRKLDSSSADIDGVRQSDTFQALYRTKDGLFLRATERNTEDGGRVITFTDITDLKLTEDKLQYQANYDFLTGIANRSYYVERLNDAVARAKRHGHKVALLQFDLDRFKQINDTLGHAVGDELLINTASRIKRNLREIDLAARTGGDEFVAIIDQILDQKEAVVSAERIVTELYQELEIDGMQIDFSASIGIALYPDHAEDVNTLMQHADIACYQAKASGRNNYQLYGADMKKQAIGLMTLEANLREAIEEDKLFVDYQPYLQLENGKLCGVEAFSRWYDSKLGLVSPSQYIPVAEKNGLIAKLGEQVLRRVFNQLRVWHSQGMNDIQVAINVSQRQLFQPALAETIDKLSEEFSIDPGAIQFEITESVITEDSETAAQHLFKLAERNIKFVLDDYGKGNSSLHRIKNLPIQTLKIDGDFIRRLTSDEGTRDIVAAMISSANNLQLDTIAECVETQEQATLLHAMGCTMIQGYFIGEPQSPEQISDRYRQLPDKWSERWQEQPRDLLEAQQQKRA